MLVAQFRPEQAGVLPPDIEPVSPADAVGGVFRLCSRTLSPHVIEIFIAEDEIIALRHLEVLIIHDRPGWSKAADLIDRADSPEGIGLDRKRPINARHVALIGVVALRLHVPVLAEPVAPG